MVGSDVHKARIVVGREGGSRDRDHVLVGVVCRSWLCARAENDKQARDQEGDNTPGLGGMASVSGQSSTKDWLCKLQMQIPRTETLTN